LSKPTFFLPSLILVAAGMLAFASPFVHAQGAGGYPTKPIRIVVPYAAGGFTDIVARQVGQKMSERLGQPVVVDNKPGASTILGAEVVARAAPDGYTLLMGVTTTLSTNPFLFKKLPYKASDFKPVALAGLTPFVLVAHPSMPGTVREVVDAAKAKPGALNVATLGIGSSTHLVLAMLRAAAGVDLKDIPYKGSAPAMSDLLAGHVHLYFDAVPTSMPYIRSGQLKGIAITSEERSPAAPSLPTFREAGVPDMVAYSWYGLLAPAGTPDAIVAQLNKAANEALQMPDVKARLAADGGVAPTLSPIQFGDLIDKHTQVWAKIIAPLNIQLD
jgi:tripartite-type tricarboxylate transporter receptor subunit TctC